MKAIHPSLLVLSAVLGCSGAFAQLKPSTRAPATAPAPSKAAAAPAPAAEAEPSPEVKEKAAAATLAASGWLVLLDRRDWGRAWETTAAIFRKSVPLAAWMDGIPKARDLGEFIEREPMEAVYKPTLEGYPPGDYVTVIYSSKFSKKEEVVEVITAVRETDGKWRVTGYQTR